MARYPKDCPARVIGTAARTLFPSKLDPYYWEPHELTGTDHGTDMIIEYIENNEYHNKKIECQIKGTTDINMHQIKNGFSYSLDIKTINYALDSSNGFLLIIIDINTEEIYCLPIQDYFIANPENFCKLKNNTTTINLKFNQENLLNEYENELKEIAKSIYIRKEFDYIEKNKV